MIIIFTKCIIKCFHFPFSLALHALPRVHCAPDTRTIKMREWGEDLQPETIEAVCQLETLIISRTGRDARNRIEIISSNCLIFYFNHLILAPCYYFYSLASCSESGSLSSAFCANEEKYTSRVGMTSSLPSATNRRRAHGEEPSESAMYTRET